MKYNQYEVVVVNLDPTMGSEIKKTRPCLIISPNEMNHHLNTIVVAPITSKLKNYPTRVQVNFQNSISWVVIDQIRTIDLQRIQKVIGSISESEINTVRDILRETFVD